MTTFISSIHRDRFSIKKAKTVDFGIGPEVNSIGVANHAMRLIQKPYIWHEFYGP